MRDYVNYDYMQAVLKKKYAEKIKECYRAFGWEIIDREEDSRYDDVYNVFFSRPHKLEHKDELHYMQVELEAHFDEISKVNRKFLPKSFFCALFTFITFLGFFAGGLCMAFLFEGTAYFVGGLVLACIGSAAGIAGVILSVKVRKKEILSAKKISEEHYSEIEKLCMQASAFTGVEYEK